MTDKELLNQALEYLEDNQHWIADGERHAYVMEYNAFIDKLKQALAQPEQEPLFKKIIDQHPGLAEELKAMDEQEQEPVAFEKTVCPFCTSEWVTAEQHDRNVDRVEQEPVGWLDSNDKLAEFMHKDLKAEHDKRDSSTPRAFQIPVYTTPPQRTWVGLTSAGRKEIERQSFYVEGAIRMTEAKLKEKNT